MVWKKKEDKKEKILEIYQWRAWIISKDHSNCLKKIRYFNGGRNLTNKTETDMMKVKI